MTKLAFPAGAKSPPFVPIGGTQSKAVKSRGGSGKTLDFFDELSLNTDNFEGSTRQIEMYFGALNSFNQILSQTKLKYNSLYTNTYGGDYDLFMAYEGANMTRDMAGLISMNTELGKLQAKGKRTIDYFNKSQAFKSEFFDEDAYKTSGERSSVMLPFQDATGDISERPYYLTRGEHAQMMDESADFDNLFPEDVMTPDYDILDKKYAEGKAMKGEDLYTTTEGGRKIINGDVVHLIASESWDSSWENPNNVNSLRIQWQQNIQGIENELSYMSKERRNAMLNLLEQKITENEKISAQDILDDTVDAEYSKYLMKANRSKYDMYVNANEKITKIEKGAYNADTESLYLQNQFTLYRDEWINNRTANSVKFANSDEKPTEVESKQDIYNLINDGPSSWSFAPRQTAYTVMEINDIISQEEFKLANNPEYADAYGEWVGVKFVKQIWNRTVGAGEKTITYNNKEYELVGFDTTAGGYPVSANGTDVYKNVFITDGKSKPISIPIYEIADNFTNLEERDILFAFAADGEGTYDLASQTIRYTINERQHIARPALIAEIGKETYKGSFFEDTYLQEGDTEGYQIVEQIYLGVSDGSLPFKIRVLSVDRIAYIDDVRDGQDFGGIASRVIGVVHTDDLNDKYVADIEDEEAHTYEDVLKDTEFKVEVSDKTNFKTIKYVGKNSAEWFTHLTIAEQNEFAKGLKKGIHYIYPYWSKRDYWHLTDAAKNKGLIEEIKKERDDAPPIILGDPNNYLTQEQVSKGVTQRRNLEESISTGGQ